MDDLRDQHSELFELLAKVADERSTADDVARLSDILRTNAAARKIYRQYMTVIAGLSWRCSDSPHRAGADGPLAPLMGEGRLAKSQAARSPVLGFLGGVIDYARHAPLLLWLAIAGVGLTAAVYFGGALIKRDSANEQKQIANVDAGKESGVRAPSGVHSVQSVARLSSAIDCRWIVDSRNSEKPSGPTTLPIGTKFLPAQKLNLVSGLAEISFTSGAKAILQGPTQFSIAHALGGDLQVGRVTVRAPKSAKGFAVNTPSGKVVDLGTEFGVKVGENHATDVTVFVGEVIVKSRASGQAAEPVHVKAGEAVELAPGQAARPIPAGREQFVRELPVANRTQEAEAEFVDEMHSLKPAVWFRLGESLADRVIRNEVVGGRDGQLHWQGAGDPFQPGVLGKCLWLRGPKFGDYVFVPDYPQASSRRITVMAWVLAESRPNGATIAANWRQGIGIGQFQFGLLSEDATGPAMDLGVRISPRDGPVGFTLGEGKGHPFPLGEWQHVAFVVDGGTLRLYRQGREVAVNNHVSFRHPGPVKPLTIGCTLDNSDQQPAANAGWWDGKIQDLAIFNDALSADDVASLAAFGPQAASPK